MIAPEKRHGREAFLCAENISGSSLALALRHDPVLDANATGARVRPARNIAGGKDAGDVCFQEFVHQHTAISGDIGVLREADVWPHADPDHHQVAAQEYSIVESHMHVAP